MRMGMRRLTRLTNAFSKGVENLAHAVRVMRCNFARPHNRTRRSPTLPANARDGGWRSRSRLDAGRDRRAAELKAAVRGARPGPPDSKGASSAPPFPVILSWAAVDAVPSGEYETIRTIS